MVKRIVQGLSLVAICLVTAIGNAAPQETGSRVVHQAWSWWNTSPRPRDQYPSLIDPSAKAATNAVVEKTASPSIKKEKLLGRVLTWWSTDPRSAVEPIPAEEETPPPATNTVVEVQQPTTETNAVAAHAEQSPATNSKLAAIGPSGSNGIARLEEKLSQSLADLSTARKRIADEKLPMSQELSRLEREQLAARKVYDELKRQADSQNLDIGNRRAKVKEKEQAQQYLSSLLTEYVRQFETNLHIAELHQHDEILKRARLAAENNALTPSEVFDAQLALIQGSVGRLEDLVGGAKFTGQAISPDGILREGTFLHFGPAVCFRSDDGKWSGEVEQKLGSMEPAILSYNTPEDSEAAGSLVSTSRGSLPFDASLGNAHKIAETKETVREHILKGGPVMAPILGLAALIALIALVKWIQFSLVRTPTEKQLLQLWPAVAAKDQEQAIRIATTLRGPAGEMLRAGTAHLKGTRELIEESMYEIVIDTRHKLNSALAFIAVGAACAPLLGLLGTVTGIITTFKMITVFGSGDIKMLSSGISEALITTEYGLYVAIPAILAHSFLTRRVKTLMDRMERIAMSFVNEMLDAENKGEG